MNERWKNELEKLQELQPPRSLSSPVDHSRPGRNLASSPKRPLWARGATIAFALTLSGGVGLLAWSIAMPQRGPESTSGASSAPNVGHIQCTAEGETILQTPIVQPQDDGVHLQVTSAGAGFIYTQDPSNPDRNWGQDLANKNGVSNVLLPIPPGDEVVAACFESESARNEFGHIMQAGNYPSIQVTDSAGAWVSLDLSCPSSETITVLDQEAIASEADPSAVVRSSLGGLRASDVIEPAGYPGWTHPLHLRILRNGVTVGSIEYGVAEGKIAVLLVMACSASGIGAS